MNTPTESSSSKSPLKMRIAYAAVALFAAVMAASGILGLVRDYGKEYFLEKEPPLIAPATRGLADKWMSSVKAEDARRSLLCASQIVPDDEFTMPPEAYLALFSSSGIRMSFLTCEWNFSDFLRWHDIFEMTALAGELCRRPESAAKDIFEAINAKVKPVPENQKGRFPPLSIMETWKSGSGNSADKTRLLCGIAGQAGFECVVVGLFKKQGEILRELCELRRDGKAWTFDTASGSVWECSARDLACRTADIPSDWSKDEKEALQGPHVLFIPAEPQDYRILSKCLWRRLRSLSVKGMPELPEDPMERLRLLRAANPGTKDFFYFWMTPLLSLRSIPGDPADWVK